MSRKEGSKNRTIKEKIVDIIDSVKQLPVDEVEKAEAIDELEDLLGEPKPSPKPAPAPQPKPERKLLGYHPITGVEVYSE